MAGFDWANLGTQLSQPGANLGTQSPQEQAGTAPNYLELLIAAMLQERSQGQQVAGDVVPLKIVPGSTSKPSSGDGSVTDYQSLLRRQWEKAPALSPFIGQSFKGQG